VKLAGRLTILALAGASWWAFWVVAWRAEFCFGWTPRKVERALEGLPRGSTRAEVEAWLNDRQIYHSQVAGVDGKPLRSLLAVVDPATIPPFYEGEVQITFYFDEDGRLDDHKLEWFTFEL
jgi:hypothetical protein